MLTCRLKNDMIFIPMSLRETAMPERAVRHDKPYLNGPAGSRIGSGWLACYPDFRDALTHASTRFGALPMQAKQVALKRSGDDSIDYRRIAQRIDDVGASYVEVATHCVKAVVEQFLAGSPARVDHDARGALCVRDERHSSLEVLLAQVPLPRYPEVARPPCLLMPGQAVFLEGWMRFFAYCARGDMTIPLLAVDWPGFVNQLQAQPLRA
jgi:hypothetical protein